jgi:hypothetical protein
MKRKFCGFLLVAGFFLPQSIKGADGPSAWLGLWRVEQRSSSGGAVIHHLQISSLGAPPKIKIYNSAWEEQATSDVTIRNDSLLFNWAVSGRPIAASVALRKGRLTGNWELVHPQYPMGGALDGQKVMSQPDWNPSSGFLEHQSPDGLIDFSRYLLEKAPLQSYEQFLQFWNSQVQPAFYPAISELLYGSAIFEPDLKDRQLRAVYTQLKDPLFRSNSKRISSLYPSIYADLKKRFPELSVKAAPITMPAFEGSAGGLRVLGGLVFVEIDAAKLGKLSETRLRYALARAALEGSALVRFRSDDPALRLLRAGLLAHLTSLLNYSKNQADFLFSSEEAIQQVEGGLAKHRSRLADMLKAPRPEEVRTFFEHAPRPGDYLGFRFVSALLEKRTFADIMEMETHDVYRELRAYLSSSQ